MFIDHRYKVLESLGTGSWANVFKVQDIRTDNIYTLKLFQYLSSEKLYSHFSAEEMHHITKIEHPNLSHVVDFGHVGDHIYIISEYFDGKTLANFRFTKSKLNVIYDIIVQTCYALHALHDQGILHKDLKPENILYRMEGKSIIIKLIDYGFSKVDTSKDNQIVSGTLPYLAPEVYLGKPASKASDYYSLGVILYRIMTGSFPFSVDQINALITGGHQYFIPNFPSMLNKDIPLALEKFILRLLERNPDSRFSSSEEIIRYINRIHHQEYPFASSWSLLSRLKNGSYLVRDKYSHELLDFLPALEHSNGKIVTVMGGDGLGKDNILSLFRYHILGGQYYIFDFNCTKTAHEAFFALIKEYLQSLPEAEVAKFTSLTTFSPKFRRYLFESEQDAKNVTQTQAELKSDFEAVKILLIELSIRKPVIFVIRNFQHVHRYTIDFINYISSAIISNRILVVLSCNDYNKVNQMEHTVMMHVLPLTLDETRIYVNGMLFATVPINIAREIHERSAGNPQFVREILTDMVQRKLITRDESLKLPETLKSYALSSRLLHLIYSKMSHLTSENYALLQKLSIVQTPLTRELILYILKISDAALYTLLNDSIYNEILYKKGKNYHFSYLEAKQRLYDEGKERMHVLVSLRVLKYYSTKELTDISTCRGIIHNAYLANDLSSVRKYYLKLYHLLCAEYEQDAAYEAILNVLKLDFDPNVEVSLPEMISDIYAFQEKTELTGYFDKAGFLMEELGMNANDTSRKQKFPELFEKYYLLGTIKLLAEEPAVSLKLFMKAAKLIRTGKQQILVWYYLMLIYGREDNAKMKYYIDLALGQDLPLEYKIAIMDRLAVYYAQMNDTDRAIKTIEDFLAQLPSEHDTRVLIRLAAMHNDLGVFYSDQKNIEEADEHLNTALSIWKRYNIKRYLGLIHNNISDLYLKQGATVISMHYSELGYQYADELNLTITKALALLNQGEALIKMGSFGSAEEKLMECRNLVLSKHSTQYLKSVERNLALAKSKIKGFGYYFQFISEMQPELIAGDIKEINPLVKTYFYYLNEMGHTKKLKRLLTKNIHINYRHLHEEEFYHNVQSLIAMWDHDYEAALRELKLAIRHAGEINNNYAIAVFYVMEITCYYGLGDIQRAAELIEMVLPIIKEGNYRYWQCSLEVMILKLDLLKPEIPLRDILRRVEVYQKAWAEDAYYQLDLKLMQIKIQILLAMKQDELAASCFDEYKKLIEAACEGISADDRENFYRISFYHIKDMQGFDPVPIAPRAKELRRNLNELIYNIANVNNPDKVLFLFQKGIQAVLAPWQYRLMQFEKKIMNYSPLQNYNGDKHGYVGAELSPYIERAFKNDALIPAHLNGRNLVIVPLTSASQRLGYLIVNDDGELPFTRPELSILRSIKAHLAALIVRRQDYLAITESTQKMNQLMQITHALMRCVQIADLEHEIVSACIDFTNSSRGFLIIAEENGSNIYKIRLNNAKQILPNAAGLSKTALSLCQSTREPLFTLNAILDNRFKSAISVQDYHLHTLFCAPIIVDNNIFGYVYLDNMDDNSRAMYLNPELTGLLFKQISIALTNAMLYEELLKKNRELNTFEMLKDEFMAIVAHELNTPLTTLQGHVSRLKRNIYADAEEKNEIIAKIETSVKKLILTATDISTMNSYNLKESLPMAPTSISEILELVQQEVQILSRKRKMFIRLEIATDLPKVPANWEALHLMIYNLVLNAIRFTNDFGNITIGARKSAFLPEKLNGKESLVIYVQDNGIGIPEYQLNNVFRKFFELNEIYAHKSGSIEYRSSGLGLGLATSQRIAELHHGKIWIKSKVNEGTTVFIAIPLKS